MISESHIDSYRPWDYERYLVPVLAEAKREAKSRIATDSGFAALMSPSSVQMLICDSAAGLRATQNHDRVRKSREAMQQRTRLISSRLDCVIHDRKPGTFEAAASERMYVRLAAGYFAAGPHTIAEHMRTHRMGFGEQDIFGNRFWPYTWIVMVDVRKRRSRAVN